MISAILFTFWPDEEDYIEVCLKTISWCDEIIIVDNGATAKTLRIVKKYTDKIFKDNSSDFSDRHNFGKEKAKGDWLLYVDADERVSVSLREEILNTLKKPLHQAYQLNRVNYYLGKKVRYGDRYPDFVARLFLKDKLVSWAGEIHESSSVEGTIGRLEAPLYHLTHRDIFSMIEKTVNFSEHEAHLRLLANHPPVVGWRLLRVLFTELYTRLIKMQGWRQGTEGWIDAIFQASSVFVVYARLWEKQRRPSLSKTYQALDEKILGEFK